MQIPAYAILLPEVIRLAKGTTSSVDKMAAAVEAGDLVAVCRQFEDSLARFYAYGEAGIVCNFSKSLQRTVVNAARSDPAQLAVDSLARVLSIQMTLLHHMEVMVSQEIARTDSRADPMTWGHLNQTVVYEHLPRLGKLQSEILSTLKVMRSFVKDKASDENRT